MKLKAALPKNERDGISHLEARLAKSPKSHVVALVILDVDGQYITPEGDTQVTLRMRAIESILPEDREEAAKFIRRAYESRTGNTTLPIELENDITAALEVGGLYAPLDDAPRIDVTEPTHEREERIIDVPEGGYGTMTIPLLIALLKKRGLDATAGKKMDLIARLEANDADPDASKPKENVVNLFNDGSQGWPATEAVEEGDGYYGSEEAPVMPPEDEEVASPPTLGDVPESEIRDEPFEQPQSFFRRPMFTDDDE